MLQWETNSRRGLGSTDCTNTNFRDVAPGVKKQCYCDSAPDTYPLQKGTENDGETYRCKGNAYYVKKFNDENKQLILGESINHGLAVIWKKDMPSDGYKCSNEGFKTDPVPGHVKQCFCDQDDQYKKEDL